MMDDGQKQLQHEPQPVSSSRLSPLHGVKLADILAHLHAEYGWAGLAERVPVRCFQNQPSLGSSLKFLRRTPWAREQLEQEYLRLTQQENANVLLDAYKRGEELDFTGVTQADLHAALGWLLRHTEQSPANIQQYFLPALAQVQDVNFWSDSETMPLLSLAIEHSKLGEGKYAPALIAELLRRGAEVNDSRYWLPLLHTVDVEGQAYRQRTRAPRTDILDMLLLAGADPALRDQRGYTALDIAQAYGLRAFVNKLDNKLRGSTSTSEE